MPRTVVDILIYRSHKRSHKPTDFTYAKCMDSLNKITNPMLKKFHTIQSSIFDFRAMFRV
jgi:hypothetical protein